MKKSLLSLVVTAVLFTGCSNMTRNTDSSLVSADISFAGKQIGRQVQIIEQSRSFMNPRTVNNNKIEYIPKDDWTSGFFPGSLWYAYELSGNKHLAVEARKFTEKLAPIQYYKGIHDVGFMMMCSYGNGIRLIPCKGDSLVLINTAKSLATRFHPEFGLIKSWDHEPDWKYPVIIDNMMNLELLFWATKNSGDSSYYKIAVTHANTTLKNHYREDHSSYHVVDYDPTNGNVLIKQTHQGYSDHSAWARGQAWGLYGYTVMYRATKDKKYLKQATDIAQFMINHPSVPADKIFYWDFNTPDIPATYRDASAAAITASALLELCKYTDAKTSAVYFAFSEQVIRALASKTYTAPIGTNGGFILKHSVGNLPSNSEVDTPLTYADYYYIEAMMRYKAMDK